MTPSYLDCHFLKEDHFYFSLVCFLFVSKCNDHMKMSCPNNAWCKNAYWICRRECKHMMVQSENLYSCYANALHGRCICECVCMWCKCLFLECLVQKSLLNMQIWRQPYDGTNWKLLVMQMSSKKKHMRKKIYAYDA